MLTGRQRAGKVETERGRGVERKGGSGGCAARTTHHFSDLLKNALHHFRLVLQQLGGKPFAHPCLVGAWTCY